MVVHTCSPSIIWELKGRGSRTHDQAVLYSKPKASLGYWNGLNIKCSHRLMCLNWFPSGGTVRGFWNLWSMVSNRHRQGSKGRINSYRGPHLRSITSSSCLQRYNKPQRSLSPNFYNHELYHAFPHHDGLCSLKLWAKVVSSRHLVTAIRKVTNTHWGQPGLHSKTYPSEDLSTAICEMSTSEISPFNTGFLFVFHSPTLLILEDEKAESHSL